jgi:hypothetical protein
MNTPQTILGVIGAGIVLTLTILKMVGDDRARKDKEKADMDAKIDKADSFADFVRVDDELRHK